ncbi:MAG: hypothetical protein ACXABY_13720 [Candidatus Thorarchaeota archaeon]|jgi:sugar phosphate permease
MILSTRLSIPIAIVVIAIGFFLCAPLTAKGQEEGLRRIEATCADYPKMRAVLEEKKSEHQHTVMKCVITPDADVYRCGYAVMLLKFLRYQENQIQYKQNKDCPSV